MGWETCRSKHFFWVRTVRARKIELIKSIYTGRCFFGCPEERKVKSKSRERKFFSLGGLRGYTHAFCFVYGEGFVLFGIVELGYTHR